MITKILNKCVENNLLFIGFKNDENKYVNNKTKLIFKNVIIVVEYEFQKTFKWLVNKSKLFLDFYLPKYNIFIECQGR
jgi:hypothetical protein